MTAMSALTLHDLSDGRFVLGLGASGPQVVEGLHSTRYSKPLSRLKETVDICRMIFAGEKVQYQGDIFQMPLPKARAKPLKLRTSRWTFPFTSPLSGQTPYASPVLPLTAGWAHRSHQTSGAFDHLEEGAISCQRTTISTFAFPRASNWATTSTPIARRKPGVAFNMGGMGSAKTNFYNDAFKRAGYADDALAIQQLWLDGKRKEAAQRVPDAMVTQFQALGDRAMVTERLAKYRDAGVTTLKLGLDSAGPIGPARYELLEQIVDITGGLS